MTDTNRPLLHWIKDDDEQYHAESGDRAYIVRTFEVGAYDGDPRLTKYDNRYRSQCWSLTTWVANTRRGPAWHFDDLAGALFAAQDAEDDAQ